MTNQIEPSHISEQPARAQCRHCGAEMIIIGGRLTYHHWTTFTDHQHEKERRLPENAKKRQVPDVIWRG